MLSCIIHGRASMQHGPTLSFFVISASYLSIHSSKFPIQISASEFSWSDHCIPIFTHEINLFATIASADQFPQFLCKDGISQNTSVYSKGKPQQMTITATLSVIFGRKVDKKLHLHSKIMSTKFDYERPSGLGEVAGRTDGRTDRQTDKYKSMPRPRWTL